MRMIPSKHAPVELLEQANRYIHAIEEVAHSNAFTSTTMMYALDGKRVAEHDKFTDLCRKHGIKLANRDEFTRYAFMITGRKLFGREHVTN